MSSNEAMWRLVRSATPCPSCGAFGCERPQCRTRRDLGALKDRLARKASASPQHVTGSGSIVAGGDIVIGSDGRDESGHVAEAIWALVTSLKSVDSDSTRLAIIQSASVAEYTIAQAISVLEAFGDDVGRSYCLGMLRGRITDRHNWHRLSAAFDGDEYVAKAMRMRPDDPLPGPSATAALAARDASRVDSEALADEVRLQRELVALEREALKIERERHLLIAPWWVRLLRWLFRRDRV